MRLLNTLQHSFLPVLAVFLGIGTLILLPQRQVDEEARVVRTIAVGHESPSPYDPYLASFARPRTPAHYRAEIDREPAYAAGREAYQAERYREAQTHFEKVLDTYPDNLMVLNQLGLVARRLGDLNAADERWRSILSRDSSYTAAHLNLGLLYSDQDREDRAEDMYRTSIRFNPFYGLAHYNLGLLLVRQERYQEAVNVLARAAQLSSGEDRAQAYHNQARAHQALGEVAEARRVYQEAIALKPDYLLARMNLASTYETDTEVGRTERKALYASILRLDPSHASAREALQAL